MVSEEKWPKVAIIVLNWNGWKDTIECLESLYQITYPNYEVIVVDNGSQDDSILQIRRYCEGTIRVESNFFNYRIENKPIKTIEYTKNEADNAVLYFNNRLIIIKNEKNYGFAEGNNIAIRFALKTLHPDYILLLNNDIVVETRFLEALVRVGESNDKIGIVGPKVCQYMNPHKIQSAGAKLRWNTGRQDVLRANEIDNDQSNDLNHVDYVAGCAFLAKVELIKRIRCFKSEYFAYWEETDFCIRACKAEYQIICTPRSKIWHKGSSTSEKISGFHIYYMTRNMFWFMQQNAPKNKYILFCIYFFGFRFWFLSGIYMLYKRDAKAFVSFLKGVRNGIAGQHD